MTVLAFDAYKAVRAPRAAGASESLARKDVVAIVGAAMGENVTSKAEIDGDSIPSGVTLSRGSLLEYFKIVFGGLPEKQTTATERHPAGPPCQSRCPLWHTRSVPPLSFPPVVSGNPVSFSSVHSFVWSCMGKAMDSRLQTSGMTAGD